MENPTFRRAPNGTLVLSRWKVQFGRYQGKTFHWLLENDVGYSVNLVASHQKERERAGSQSPLMANKVGPFNLTQTLLQKKNMN